MWVPMLAQAVLVEVLAQVESSTSLRQQEKFEQRRYPATLRQPYSQNCKRGSGADVDPLIAVKDSRNG